MHIYCPNICSKYLPSSYIKKARQTKLKPISPVSLKSASSARKLLQHVKPQMKVSKQDYTRLVVPQTVVCSQSRRPRRQAEEVNLITFRLFEGSEFVYVV